MTYTADAYNAAIPATTDPCGEATQKELVAIKNAITGGVSSAGSRGNKVLRFNAAGTSIVLIDDGPITKTILASGVASGAGRLVVDVSALGISNIHHRIVYAQGYFKANANQTYPLPFEFADVSGSPNIINFKDPLAAGNQAKAYITYTVLDTFTW